MKMLQGNAIFLLILLMEPGVLVSLGNATKNKITLLLHLDSMALPSLDHEFWRV